MLLHQSERFFRIEVADDYRRRVVRTVERSVVVVHLIARDALHIVSPADGRPLVGMSLERGCIQLVVHQALRVVFVTLEFGAHDGHLRLMFLRVEEAVHHPVGFDAHRQLEMLAGHGRVVEREVLPRGGVAYPAVPADEPVDLALLEGLGALELHVLQEM